MAKGVKTSKAKGLDVRIGYLTNADQRDWLQAHSEATGVPITAIIRRAVEAYRQGIARKAAK